VSHALISKLYESNILYGPRDFVFSCATPYLHIVKSANA